MRKTSATEARFLQEGGFCTSGQGFKCRSFKVSLTESMRVGSSVELALDILPLRVAKYVVFVEIRGIGRAEASFLEPLISSASEPLCEPLFWLDHQWVSEFVNAILVFNVL